MWPVSFQNLNRVHKSGKNNAFKNNLLMGYAHTPNYVVCILTMSTTRFPEQKANSHFSLSLPKTLILSLSLHFLFNFASNFTHFPRWQLISFFDFNILGLWKCVSSFLSIVFYEFFTFLSISLRGTYFLLSLFSFGFLMKMQVCAMSLILLYFEFFFFFEFLW